MRYTNAFKRVSLFTWLCLVLLTLVGPYILLGKYSVSLRNFNGGVVNSLSFESWTTMLTYKSFQVVYYSLSMALMNTALCILFGIPLAVWLWRLKGLKKQFFYLLLVIPLGISILLISYSWQIILGNSGLINSYVNLLLNSNEVMHLLYSPFSIHLALLGAYISYFTLTFNASIEKIRFEYIIGSLALGASALKTFRLIVFPIAKPGFVTGSLLVFLPSFAEYVIPKILGGGKSFFVGTYASYLFFEGKNWPLGSAFFIGTSVLLIFITSRFIKFIKGSFIEN